MRIRITVVLAVVLALSACGENEGNEGHGGSQTDSACSTGQKWTGGNEDSPLMDPGQACVACHEMDREAGKLAVAGTVYGKTTDADNCFGVQGYTVEITDAAGTVHTMTTNEAGNFYKERATIATPYMARIITPDGTTRQMLTAQTVTDCNSCHTQAGANLAPGRL